MAGTGFNFGRASSTHVIKTFVFGIKSIGGAVSDTKFVLLVLYVQKLTAVV